MTILFTVYLHTVFLCSFCGVQYQSDTGVLRHEERKHYKLTLNCDICGKNLWTRSDLQKHRQNVHLSTKRYRCSICDKEFKSKYYMEIHLRVHSGVKPFSCSVCGKTFAQRQNRNSHQKRHDKTTTHSGE